MRVPCYGFFALLQFDAIKKYIDSGGSVMLLLGEGGESKLGTNVNYLIEEYGVSVNSDCVVRTVMPHVRAFIIGPHRHCTDWAAAPMRTE